MGRLLSFKLIRDEMHKKLGGGIPEGSLLLIEGESGTGKSVFLQRLAYGFLENEIGVTYISTQMTTKNFINQMYSLSFPILSFLASGKLLFIPVYPLIGEKKTSEGFIKKIVESEQLYKSNVVIFDTISDLIKDTVNKENTEYIVKFFKRLTGVGKTLFLAANPEDLDRNIFSVFKNVADLHFITAKKKVGDRVKHSLLVSKYVGALHEYEVSMNFRIVSKIGFVIEISTVA